MIKEENIPNIKNHFLKKDGTQPTNENNANVLNSLIEILKDKLRSNLKKMPSIYSYNEQGQQVGAY